jgi:hypothetical protein
VLSIGEFLLNVPMEKFKMLLGLGLALSGVIPFLAGVALIALDPSGVSTAIVIIGAGGSMIAAGLSLIAVTKATTNSDGIKQTLAEIQKIRICSRPESAEACQYEKTVEMATVKTV